MALYTVADSAQDRPAAGDGLNDDRRAASAGTRDTVARGGRHQR